MTDRKRQADNQLTRDDRDAEEEFVTTPQIASAEELAKRKIVRVQRPTAEQTSSVAAAFQASNLPSAAPSSSPFGSVLGPFGAATPKVAASPFAAFGGASQPAAAPAPSFGSKGFSFGFGAPAPAPAPSTEAPAAPAATTGFTFNFGAKVDFSQAVNAFSAAQKAVAESSTAAAADDDGDEDPEAEVPILPTGEAPKLQAVESCTGEEDEYTVVEVNGKLFELSKEDKKWHERGAGSLKINAKEVDGKKRCRAIMRDAKLKKGLLNCLLDDTFRIGQKQEKHFTFTAPVNGTVSTFLVKISGAKPAEDTKLFLDAAEAQLKA